MTIKKIYEDSILILDFGSQYTQLIARRIRELNVYCKLCTWDVSENQIKQIKPKGIILSGSPESVINLNGIDVQKYIFSLGLPILGICYGMQIMAVQLGGKVESSEIRELGHTQLKIINKCILVDNIHDTINTTGTSFLQVWMSHGDKVTVMPTGFFNVASTQNCPFAIIANEEKNFYGVQFHPEVTHTPQGLSILKRFVFDICGCKTQWKSDNIIKNTIKDIRKIVGNDKVILGLSGGVDSSVAAIILHRAIGKRLICVFVDNGLLRLNEAQQVMNIFSNGFDLNIVHISAQDRFLKLLAGKIDPEIKRKIIGCEFIEIFNETANKLSDVKWLAQGTIYPDIIESAGKDTSKTHLIKSHHNVGGLPNKMQLGLIEPLKELFKDEVHKIGLELGLPCEILYRHPFPGPGLGVRIVGEVKKEYCDLLRAADAIFIEELCKAGLYNKVSQAFAIFLPIRSVGIMGDTRKYDRVVSLRAIETIDFMTAKWAHLPYDFLELVSNRIINEVNGISRVVYDISSKPPATIEWE
ncbi:glutamine-hydrolyzing GMP synthase [Candidatus Pantoea carbekii]|uniref:GMP synthase [glutamine-hydrolyzing] n=1 Tax=Candidatus Pantoea carbekii TaxID=1235990 RepID=U3U2L3_9GAMM|nr:glutamine-hydrolyzing GMP synthase [Candidatus Pantoea carbekii]AKC31857.1 GMP synthase glutamine-hydrolyzing GuaA [Candidatus Pantoea carbekii]BAO00371.1 GMP synthase [Candidatus Pantoea carbekii]